MPLTDTALRSAKPRAKSFKLFDAGGFYLDVWYSRQIAKQQNLAAPRSAETIRKHMKK
jgi:hypothetical protein